MRLPDDLVERAAEVLETPEHAAVELEDEARNALSAALSPEAIRELATGPCSFCGGEGVVPAPQDAEGSYEGGYWGCKACKGYRSLVAAWLAEDAVIEAVADPHRPRGSRMTVYRRCFPEQAREALSAAAGALSERSGE